MRAFNVLQDSEGVPESEDNKEFAATKTAHPFIHPLSSPGGNLTLDG